MTVGPRGSCALLPRTQYALVETTGHSYAGLPVGKLRSGKDLVSAPLLLRLGRGTGAYSAGGNIRRCNRLVPDALRGLWSGQRPGTK